MREIKQDSSDAKSLLNSSSLFQEIENIQHILWLNFQDSAHFTAALCKDRGVTNSNLLQFQFQQSAIAVTRLYKGKDCPLLLLPDFTKVRIVRYCCYLT